MPTLVIEADRSANGKYVKDLHTAHAREHILAASIALHGGDTEEAKRRIEQAKIRASHSQNRGKDAAFASLEKAEASMFSEDAIGAAKHLDDAYGNLQGEPHTILKLKKAPVGAGASALRVVPSGPSLRAKREAEGSSTPSALRETLTFYPRFVEGSYNPDTRTVDVVIISEGLGNGRDKHYYSDQALREAVATKVFDGAQAYADHPSKFDDANRPERSIRDLIGYYFDTRIVESNGRTAIGAKLRIQEGCDWALGLIREAINFNLKFPNLVYVGISINADGDVVPGEVGGNQVNKVVRITEAFSADVVTKPARGGRFLKLVEGANGAPKPKDASIKENKVSAKVLEAAAQLEKLAEGEQVDSDVLKQIATAIRESAKAETKESKDGKDGELSEGDGDGDEDDTAGETDAAVVAKGKGKESAEAGKGNLIETEDVKKKYPSLYAAALKEASAAVKDDVVALRKERDDLVAEKAMRESSVLAVRKLKESSIPEGGHREMLTQLIGHTSEEMDEIIKAREDFIESLGVSTKRTQGAGAKDDYAPLRESDVAANTNALVSGCVIE